MGQPRVALQKRMAFPWEGTFEKWSRVWVRKHYWRVRGVLPSEEDALQHCAMVFTRCLNAYADKIDNAAWLMGLYKVAVANEWNRLAVKDGRHRELHDIAEPPPLVETTGEYQAGPLLSSIGSELREAVTLLLNAPCEVIEALRGATTDAQFDRRASFLLGLPRKRKLRAELRELLD